MTAGCSSVLTKLVMLSLEAGSSFWHWRLLLPPMSSEPLWPSQWPAVSPHPGPSFFYETLSPAHSTSPKSFICLMSSRNQSSLTASRVAGELDTWTHESFLLGHPEVFLAVLAPWWAFWVHHSYQLTMVSRALETWTWDVASSLPLLRYLKAMVPQVRGWMLNFQLRMVGHSLL